MMEKPVNGDSGAAVALALDPTRMRLALVDVQGLVAESYLRRLPPRCSGSDARESLLSLVRLALRGSSRGPFSVTGVGVAVSGVVDRATGIPLGPVWDSPWVGIPLGKALRAEIPAEVSVENMAAAGAMGEAAFGAGRDASDIIYVTAGATIEAGIVLGGRLVGGALGAGQLGHVVVEGGGPRCWCGRNGCLEAVASTMAVRRTAAELWARRRPRGPGVDPGGRGPGGRPGFPSLGRVAAAAGGGDAAALESFRRAGWYVGSVLAGLVAAVGPRKVIVGGALAAGSPAFVSELGNAFMAHAGRAVRRRVAICVAELEPFSSLIGAAVPYVCGSRVRWREGA